MLCEKTINLDEEEEPDIYNEIRQGALVEKITFIDGTDEIVFTSKKIIENERVSYPLCFITNALHPSGGVVLKNIFLLSVDA